MIMRQPQSVTVLFFITVLIVLLLILTVMVHMQEQKTENVRWKNRWRKDGFWIRYVQILRLSIMLN